MPIFSPTVTTMRFQPIMVPRPRASATATLTQVGMNLVDLSRKPLVVGDGLGVGGGDLGGCRGLGEQAEGLAGEVHLVADVGLHVRRDTVASEP